MSLKWSFVILLLLMIPFFVRSFAPALEPYPAVLLPLGIGLFNMDSTSIEVEVTEILGINENGEWEMIYPEDFLNPIPRYYLYPVSQNNFGLESKGEKVIRTAIDRTLKIPKKTIKEKEIQATESWYRQRLTKLGFIPDSFKVTKIRKWVSINNGKVTNELVADEKIYKLN